MDAMFRDKPVLKSKIVVHFILTTLSCTDALWHQMIEFERFRGKWSWPNVRYYPGICVAGLKNTIKSFSDNSWCPGKGPNWIYPHYKLKEVSG